MSQQELINDLTDEINDLTYACSEYKKKVEKLQKENERLKACYKTAFDLSIEKAQECGQLQAETNILKGALERIKEIVPDDDDHWETRDIIRETLNTNETEGDV